MFAKYPSLVPGKSPLLGHAPHEIHRSAPVQSIKAAKTAAHTFAPARRRKIGRSEWWFRVSSSSLMTASKPEGLRLPVPGPAREADTVRMAPRMQRRQRAEVLAF